MRALERSPLALVSLDAYIPPSSSGPRAALATCKISSTTPAASVTARAHGVAARGFIFLRGWFVVYDQYVRQVQGYSKVQYKVRVLLL